MFLLKFVCLSVCLSAGLLKQLQTNFHEIFGRGKPWDKKQWIGFLESGSGICFIHCKGAMLWRGFVLWMFSGFCFSSIRWWQFLVLVVVVVVVVVVIVVLVVVYSRTFEHHCNSTQYTAQRQFLLCDAVQVQRMPPRGVRPSVRPSVTFMDSVKTSNDIFRIFSPSGSQIILVFSYQTLQRYSDRDPINRGVECRWGTHKLRFLTISWLSIDDCCSSLSTNDGRRCSSVPRLRCTFVYGTETATHQWIRRRWEKNLFVRSGKSEAEIN